MIREAGVRFVATGLLMLALAGCVAPRRPVEAPRPAPSRPVPALSRPASGNVVDMPVSLAPKTEGALPAAPPPAGVKPGKTARASGVRPGPAVETLGMSEAGAAAALAAFRVSCPSVQRRTDGSGLTRKEDWVAPCKAATETRPQDARAFFAQHFETAVIGDGKALATGYYEPEILGSRDRRRGYEVPIYARPTDLVEIDLGLFARGYKGKKVRGQAKDGRFNLYPDRAAIVDGALDGRGLEIAWAADPVEFFFLQVQGSGRLILPDGGVMRVGYDSQNGRDYVGIGKLMRDRGLITAGQTSMQGIMARLRQDPNEGNRIMNENKSFVFFRELTGAGPLGALGLPVTGRETVAADPAFVPLGAPVFLALDRREASGLWVAQDTGGAIKGANRFDTYWGGGTDARTIAGGMMGRGTAWLLLPKGSVARLNGNAAGDGTTARR